MESDAIQKGTGDAYGNGQKKPKPREERGDLTKEIEGEHRVVPNFPSEIQIEKATCRKFHRRDYESTAECAENKRVPRKPLVGKIDQTQTDAAAYSHCPVGKSSKKDLYEKISYGSHTKQKGEKQGGAADFGDVF